MYYWYMTDSFLYLLVSNAHYHSASLKYSEFNKSDCANFNHFAK